MIVGKVFYVWLHLLHLSVNQKCSLWVKAFPHPLDNKVYRVPIWGWQSTCLERKLSSIAFAMFEWEHKSFFFFCKTSVIFFMLTADLTTFPSVSRKEWTCELCRIVWLQTHFYDIGCFQTLPWRKSHYLIFIVNIVDYFIQSLIFCVGNDKVDILVFFELIPFSKSHLALIGNLMEKHWNVYFWVIYEPQNEKEC